MAPAPACRRGSAGATAGPNRELRGRRPRGSACATRGSGRRPGPFRRSLCSAAPPSQRVDIDGSGVVGVPDRDPITGPPGVLLCGGGGAEVVVDFGVVGCGVARRRVRRGGVRRRGRGRVRVVDGPVAGPVRRGGPARHRGSAGPVGVCRAARWSRPPRRCSSAGRRLAGGAAAGGAGCGDGADQGRRDCGGGGPGRCYGPPDRHGCHCSQADTLAGGLVSACTRCAARPLHRIRPRRLFA